MGGSDHPNRINFNLALTHRRRMGIGEMRNIFAFDFIIVSPGQDIPTAIESAVEILAIFASKIETWIREKDWSSKQWLVSEAWLQFFGLEGSRPHQRASPTPFSKCCCPLSCMTNLGRPNDKVCRPYLRTPGYSPFSGVQFSQIVRRSIMTIILLNPAGLRPIG